MEHTDDAEVEALLAIVRDSAPARSLPPADLLRQVRDAVAESYEGGHEVFDDKPESVQNYCAGDGGLLRTLNLAVALLEEREEAETDAELVEQVAMLLARQNSVHADGDWNEEQPQGWASGEARRDAYRMLALEVLRLVTPRLMQAFGNRYGHQLLPQWRDIVNRLP